ncbi:lipid A-modifier LpxR family protein [Flammeovirga agarivorans]|uniref:Lipid A deacylase LpxR family protein n=1 Tax=Flammeovirga agarivorans TaxID=2726742 RepID=A0A7X8SPN9_9BACT|nr:lipid A-modifier LpxR family protein [Flammeovirga agarivorans]NLR94015.1 lipid A deacylase LpxR family protein [Flammeovirga agarivorans]
MLKNYYFLIVLLFSTITLTYAQDEEKTKGPVYLSINVDEDLFLLKSTDQFYSFGANIRVGFDGLDNNFTNSFLPKLSESHQLFDIGIVHKMYTPRNVSMAEVDSSDIPYCGETYLSIRHNSLSPSSGTALMTQLDVGVVGQISGAEKFQNGFHSAIGNGSIDGWKNQIGNGLYLNYTATILRSFVSNIRFADAFLGARGTMGTMDISFEGFVYLRLGLFNDYFINADRPYSKKSDTSYMNRLKGKGFAKMKFEDVMWSEDPTLREKAVRSWLSRNFRPYQVYMKFISGGILNVYDGEMQGSLISFEHSPYTIDYDLIPKWQHRLMVGVVFNYHFGSLEYTWQRITYQPEDNFPPYYPKWGTVDLHFNI